MSLQCRTKLLEKAKRKTNASVGRLALSLDRQVLSQLNRSTRQLKELKERLENASTGQMGEGDVHEPSSSMGSAVNEINDFVFLSLDSHCVDGGSLVVVDTNNHRPSRWRENVTQCEVTLRGLENEESERIS